MHKNNLYHAAHTESIRLLVVDDHILACEALTYLLTSAEKIAVVGTSTTVEQALQTSTQLKPDVILLDALLPRQGAFECAAAIQENSSHPKVLLLDDKFSVSRINQAMQIPVAGYFLRSTPFRVLLEGIRLVTQNRMALDPKIKSQVTRGPGGYEVDPRRVDSPLALLTKRELEVLRYLAEGYTVKQCAAELMLAESTVDNHKSRLMKKLDVHKSAELTRIAIREGVITG